MIGIQTQIILALAAAMQNPPISHDTLHEIRTKPSLYGYVSTDPIKDITQISIPVNDGHIDLCIYTPLTPPTHKRLPVFINFHGGGWALGDLYSNQGECRTLCSHAECLVVSVDYRLAPENPFPIPFNDCYQAAQWVCAHIDQYQGDPTCIAIGGISAGGTLAAAVALKALTTGDMNFVGQVLMVPALNDRCNTPSYEQYGEGFMLTTCNMKWLWHAYLAHTEDHHNPYACPLAASAYEGLPDTLILTAEYDPLRDDGYEYAMRLRHAGVTVMHATYPSIHGFITMADRIDEGVRATEDMVIFLKTLFYQNTN